jgi:hypothetical protein
LGVRICQRLAAIAPGHADGQDRPSTEPSNGPGPGNKEGVMTTTPDAEYQVVIEDQICSWDKPTITGQEIRQLGGIPEDADVVKVDLVTGEQEPLKDDEEHELPHLEPGKGLVKRIAFRRA